MQIRKMILAIMISAICCSSCTYSDQSSSKSEQKARTSNSNEAVMRSYISMFEIPVQDISRAIKFYQALLDIEIEEIEFEGMHMGIFPYEEQLVNVVLIQAEGYQASGVGPVVYLNAGENLEPVLARVESHGGKILLAKTAHADNSGYFALFQDSEGNKLALNSPH
tara:strand:+ start:74 stop:571 length:498 start_codon:yes stop_codon:yes gene_type:complete